MNICAPEIEPGSSFDGKLLSCKTHGGWLATYLPPRSVSATVYSLLWIDLHMTGINLREGQATRILEHGPYKSNSMHS